MTRIREKREFQGLLCCVFLGVFVKSQSPGGSIRGHISDEDDHSPLVRVAVVCVGTSSRCLSDSVGGYVFGIFVRILSPPIFPS